MGGDSVPSPLSFLVGIIGPLKSQAARQVEMELEIVRIEISVGATGLGFISRLHRTGVSGSGFFSQWSRPGMGTVSLAQAAWGRPRLSWACDCAVGGTWGPSCRGALPGARGRPSQALYTLGISTWDSLCKLCIVPISLLKKPRPGERR